MARFRLTGIVLIVLALGGFAAFKLRHQPARGSISIGDPAPAFTLPRLDGGTTDLSSFRGTVVLVNFWATWCPPCLEEMPSLEALHRDLRSRRFAVVAVSIDQGRDEVAAFARKLALSFPVLLDAPQVTTKRYALTGVPETYLIDDRGIVVEKYLGPRDWKDPKVRADIEPLLGLP